VERDTTPSRVTPRADRFIEITPSVANRTPAPRKRGSVVGTVVDPFRQSEVWYDSGLEEKWLHVLMATPGIAKIEEQQRVNFVTDGNKRHHYFDFVVTWSDGWRSACPIKYADDVKPGLLRDLRAIADQVGDTFADDFRLLTDKDVDATTIANARQIVSCGLDFDHEAQTFILEQLPSLDDRVALETFDRLAGDGNRGSRAAIALLQRGDLSIDPGHVLGHGALLCNRFTT
jgi:hypothetical protein